MQLTRERIITAAIELIEQEGADAVSMRRIAAELGSGVMSLYNHVPSKAVLLDAVAERILSGIDFTIEPGMSWEDQVRGQARAFRQIGRTYPRCTMVVVSRPINSATAMLPMEHALATLRDAGFSAEDAVRVVRTFIAYIIGSLLREVGVSPGLGPQRPLNQDPAVLSADRPLHLNPAEFPQVVGMSDELMNRDHDADFEFGLNLLVNAVAGSRAS
ncbi:MAG TPA: TetR/AcrR family transcriptional regulator C-terminal domain-containing protein [Streptosporangiaceae bacterium]|nr:TetR/AcrR family transcriptional regulator C-terminal domain-containing protein [Streptosporangiaceae bacterium]